MVDENSQNSTGPIKSNESSTFSTPIKLTKELQVLKLLHNIKNQRPKRYLGDDLDTETKEFIYSYSWALPTMPILRTIQNFVGQEKILEIGAGTGLWCFLLKKLGVNIDAVDNQDWEKNTIEFEYWNDVENKSMDEIKKMIPKYKIIMMVWPTNKDESAYEYLKLFTEVWDKKNTEMEQKVKQKVILIRDYKKGEYLEDLETGTFYFHKYLEKYYNEPLYWARNPNENHISPELSKKSVLILAERNSIPLDNEEKFYQYWEFPDFLEEEEEEEKEEEEEEEG